MRIYELIKSEPLLTVPLRLQGTHPVLLTGEHGVELSVRAEDGCVCRALVIHRDAATRVSSSPEPYDCLCAIADIESKWSSKPQTDIEAKVKAILITEDLHTVGGLAALAFFLFNYSWADLIWIDYRGTHFEVRVSKEPGVGRLTIAEVSDVFPTG